MNSPDAWPLVKLGDIAEFQNGGAWNESEYQERGIPVVRVTNCKSGTVDMSDCKFLAMASYERYKRHKLIAGDLIVTTVGSHPTQPGSVVGRTSVVPPHANGALLNQNAVRLRSIPNTAEQGFLNAYSRTKAFQNYIIAHARGAANQVRMSISLLKDMSLSLPPISVQGRIASILSAYDDLIENNTRRIAILEEMARRIYEEWFVHFRFPGHEQVKLVESELGLIPEGWRVAELQDFSSYINRGITPKYDDEAAGIVINQKCIRDQRLSLEASRRQSKQVTNDKLVRRGDVLINSTGVGTLGRVAQVLTAIDNCTVDTHVSIARPLADVDQNWYGMALLALQPYFEQQGIGATGQTELGRTRIAETKVLVSPKDIQGHFGVLVAPIRELSRMLGVKNANLRTTRDLLLPKLISGELDVSNLPEPEAFAA